MADQLNVPNSPGDDALEDKLAELLGLYIDRLNAGEFVDHGVIAAEHPEWASHIISELENLQLLNGGDIRAISSEAVGTLGDYTLRRQIGRGGMGVVYEAWESSMERAVALKVLPAGIAADDRAFQRFLQEAKTAGKLSHQNIVPVYSTGIKEGTPWFSMELVEGETLAQILARVKEAADDADTPFGKKGEQQFFLNVARAFADVADGLQHAHSKGVTHRDVKPSNLILDADGRLRILDFGLARLEGQESLTVTGDFVGTPLYMSPEQARRKKIPVDHRADIYSIGATLYEALCGRPPFRGKDHADTLSQIIERDPVEPSRVNPRVPPDLETIVLKCLRKQAADRYGTAEALEQDLRRFVRGDAVEARPESHWERVWRRVATHRKALAVAAVAFTLLAACGVLAYQLRVEARKGRSRDYERRVEAAAMKILHADTTPIKRGSPLLGGESPPDFGTLARMSLSAVKEAVRTLEIEAKAFPDRVDAHYWRARGLWLLEKDAEAFHEVEQALRCDETFTPARVLRESFDRYLNAPTPTRRDSDDLRNSAWARAWLRAREAVRRKRWQDAVRAYSQLIDLEEADRSCLGSLMEFVLRRGLAYLELGDFDAARRNFVVASTRSLDHWDRFLVPQLLEGKAYCLEGKFAKAEATFRRLFERSSNKPDAAMWISVAYANLGDAARSLAWSRELVSLVPEDVRNQVYHGRLLLHDLWRSWSGRFPSVRESESLRELVETAEKAYELAPRDRELTACVLEFLYDEDGRPSSTAKGRYVLQFDENFGTYDATWRLDYYEAGADPLDPGAQPIGDINGISSGRRLPCE